MEKTFEQLIQENKIQCDYFHYGLQLEIAYKLLKQVREATIAECKKINDAIILSEVDLHTTKTLMDKIKTDRILITEKEE